MKVAILGAGGVGLGTAAFLKSLGHEPMVWSPTGRSLAALAAGRPLTATGALQGEFQISVAANCQTALNGAAAIVIAVPAYAHRDVIDAAVAHLSPGQTLILSSQYSFSALYASKQLVQLGLSVPIVAWGTTIIMGRATSSSEVAVLTVRSRIDAAPIPAGDETSIKICQSLLGDRFEHRANLLAIQLSNINPPAHMANALCNLTRIEKGEDWGNYDGITPTVGALIEALDVERLAVAKACGVEVRTAQEHMHRSFDLPYASMSEMAQAVHKTRGGSPGPTSLDARWFRDDIPYGIVPLTILARIAGVPTPLHAAGIVLFSALLKRDMQADNNLIRELPLEVATLTDLRRLVQHGWVNA